MLTVKKLLSVVVLKVPLNRNQPTKLNISYIILILFVALNENVKIHTKMPFGCWQPHVATHLAYA